MQLSHGIRRRFSSPAAVSGLWDAVLAQGGFESMMLTSSQRTHLEDTFSLSTDQLLAELVQLTAKFAIPPISNFDIGAAALGASGDVYLGVNLEFPGNSISATVHGEQYCSPALLCRFTARLSFSISVSGPVISPHTARHS